MIAIAAENAKKISERNGPNILLRLSHGPHRRRPGQEGIIDKRRTSLLLKNGTQTYEPIKTKRVPLKEKTFLPG